MPVVADCLVFLLSEIELFSRFCDVWSLDIFCSSGIMRLKMTDVKSREIFCAAGESSREAT